MIDAVTFDMSGATSQTFTIPDASGLAPLKVPVGWPNHSHHFDDELPQPSPDAMARFQAAMAEPAAAAPAAPKPTTDKQVTLPASDKHVTLPTTDKHVIGKQVAGEIVEQPVGSRVPRDRVPTEHTDIPSDSGRAGRTDSTNDSGRAGRASLPDGLVRTERVDIPSGTPAIHSQPDGIGQDRRQTTDDKQATLPTSDRQAVGKQVAGEIVEQPVGSRVPRDRVPTEHTDISSDSGRAGRASLPDDHVRAERTDIPRNTPTIHSLPDGIEQDRRLTTDDKQVTLPTSDRQVVGKQVVGEIVEQPVGSRVPRDRVPTEHTDIPSDSGRAGRASLPEGQVRVERTDIPSGLVRAERVDIPSNTPAIHSLPDGIGQDWRLTTDDKQVTLPTSDTQVAGKQVVGEIVEQPVGSRVPRDRVPTERTDIPSDSGRAGRASLPEGQVRAERTDIPSDHVRTERTNIPSDLVRAERTDIPSGTPAIHSLPDGIGQDRRLTTDDKQVTLPTSDTQVVGKQVVGEIVEQPVGSRVPRDRVPTERTDIPSDSGRAGRASLPEGQVRVERTDIPSDHVRTERTNIPSDLVRAERTDIPSGTPAIHSLPDGIEQDRRPTTDDKQATLPTSDRQAVGKQVVGEIVEQPVGSRVPRDRVPTERTDIPSDSGRAGRASLPDGQVRAERTDIPIDRVRAERVDIPSGTPTIHSLPDGIEQDRRPTTDDKQVTLPTSDRQVAGKQVAGEIVEQPVGSRVPRDRVPTERTDIPSDSGRAGRASLPDGQVRAERTDIPIDRVRAERTDIPSDHVRTERTNIPRDRVRTERNDIPMMQPTDDIPTLPSTDNIPTLQAAPVSAPVAPDVAPAAIADAIAIEIDPAAATAKTRELVEAASQVADTILVTPSLVRGDGEITIRLKPTVLDGSEIRMEAKGSSISIHIVPATPSVAQTIEQAKAQFEQTLAERLPSFQIAVSVENLKTSTRKRQTA